MTNVTMKDTKQVIYDALTEAQAKLEATKSQNFNPVEEAKKVETAKSVTSAKTAVKENIFSEELNKKYNDLEVAIEVSENRIKELYGIEKTLIDMTTTLNAHKELVAKVELENKEKTEAFKADYEKQKSDLETNISDYKEQIKLEKQQLNKEYGDLKEKLELERQREKEEFEYELKRQRTKDSDAWEDEKKAREKAIKEQEDAIEGKLEYYKELELKVKDFDNIIVTSIAQAVEENTTVLRKDFDTKETLAKKEHEYQVSRLEDRVDTLTNELDRLYADLQTKNEKLDEAYTKINELAGKTVEANGSVKFIGQSTEKK